MLASAWLWVGTMCLLSAQNTPTFDIRRATVIAFFPPVTDSKLAKDFDTNAALDDFQFYATQVKQPLENIGVDFREVYVHDFRVRLGKTVTTFRPVEVDVGYYFVAPGKKPRIEYGVMTDVDLLQVAKEYFGAVQKGEKTCNLALFGRELNAAMKEGDAGKVGLLVSYPLRVNDERGSYYIKDAASLQGRFADIFTSAVRKAITSQQLDPSNCDPTQFMYGDGDVWVTSTEHGYAITAVNVPGGSEHTGAVGRVEFTCRTDSYRVIVDIGLDGELRFRAWNVGHPLVQKPDTELLHGKAGVEGTGSCSYRVWSFNDGDKRLSVEGLGCFSDRNPPPSAATGQFVTATGATAWCF